MKTKTSILTALIALASGAGAMAQVYSQNVVGYVNVNLPSGFSLISNPLTGSNNTVPALFNNPVDGMAVYQFNGSGYNLNSYEFGEWSNPNMTLAPGEGFFFYNSGPAYTQTFVGEVATGDTSNPVPPGFSLQGALVPQVGGIQTVHGYVPTDGDGVYEYNGSGYTLKSYEFGEWSQEPIIEIAEGFWIDSKKSTVNNWNRTFNPNN